MANTTLPAPSPVKSARQRHTVADLTISHENNAAPASSLMDGGRPQSHPAARSGEFGCSDREALYADFQPLVRRLIRQYGEDPELRQDLSGEIYCRFCELLDSYDPSRGIPLRAYLVRTLTASVYTYTRSQWRRQHREINLDPSAQAEGSPHVDPSGQWDRDLMMQEVLSSLPEAIALLPVRQRQVVIWRYYESRSFEEIAALLRIRPATARSLLRHGLNNLRRLVTRARSLFE
jgi:RNA polymerase sigma factor (sigma-70 family)